MLEKVPLDKKEWKPHEKKSMTLGSWQHILRKNFKWISEITNIDDYDFATKVFKPNVAASQEELISIFQTNLETAVNDLSLMTDEDFNKPWIVRRGEQVYVELRQKSRIRGWAFSHHDSSPGTIIGLPAVTWMFRFRECMGPVMKDNVQNF